MNVAFDPWIPVMTVTGKCQLVSLYSVLADGGRYADLAVRPHERVALMRLLLCVAHVALDGPKDYDEWCEVPQRLPDAARNYLTEWKESFELFHPDKPWLQIKELTGSKASPTALLDFELATGNNSTLHDHAGQNQKRELSKARISLALLTFQNFSSGGGSPVATWRAVKTSQVGNPDAPCLSQSMAHCMIRGNSLAKTIHLNLPTYETVSSLYKGCITYKENKKNNERARSEMQDIDIGKPIWEFYPDGPEKDSPQAINATQSYLGRLVPLSRWIRLLDQTEMYCCCGFKYETFKDGFPAEPTASVHVVTKKDEKGKELSERQVLRVMPSKALWRELSALLVRRSAFGLGGALAMGNAPDDSVFDFHVCAMTRDQASMDIAVESVFRVTPSFQNQLSTYQAEIEGAEILSRRLGWAVEGYRGEMDGAWEGRLKGDPRKSRELKTKLHSIATNHFWTTIEKNLSLLMSHIEAIGTDQAIPTREAWRKMLFATACDAYRIACGQETPRQIKAFAKGWQKLTARKDESMTTEPKEEVA
jgi:CRISPR system Cascade subunit CasA